MFYFNGIIRYGLTWQNGRQLAATAIGTSRLTYKYNADGIRTSKTVNGVEHIYTLSGTKILTESWGDHLNIYLYDESGSPVGFMYRNSSYAEDEFDTYFYEKNLQGDIVAIYNEAGTKLISYYYDGWGNARTVYSNSGMSTTAIYNPFKYRGYYQDETTGFYYLNSRYYDPILGRFINPDDISYLGADGGLTSYNLYAYCSNNPVSYCDPEGHFAITTFLICVGVGALIGGTLGGITAYSEGQDILTGILTGAFLGAAAGAVVGVGSVATLSGAVSSFISKSATDLISVAFYGGEFGSWEDYATAFVFGGLTGTLGNVTGKFAWLAKGAKFTADVTARPFANQLVKMGTRGNTFNSEKYLYDVVNRAATYGGSQNIIQNNVLGLNLKVDLGKCFYRATSRMLFSYI